MYCDTYWRVQPRLATEQLAVVASDLGTDAQTVSLWIRRHGK